MISFIRNLIKRAFVTLKADYSKDIPTVQCSYLGDTVEAQLFNPYGLYTIPPVGESAITFSVLGQEDNLACMPTGTTNKIIPIEEGEVAVGNPTSDTYTLYNDQAVMRLVAGIIEMIPRQNLATLQGRLEVTEYFTSTDASAMPIARVGDEVLVNGVTGIITTGSPNAKVT